MLEVCVRNSGKLFHNEIGKYRFLNELIRVVSPKYLGPRSNPEVKKRIVEIMYRSVQILFGVVPIKAILFLKSMSESVGSDIQRLRI